MNRRPTSQTWRLSGLIFSIGLLIAIVSCGKVSQETGLDNEKVPSFDLVFSIPITATAQIAEKVKLDPKYPTRNYFTVEDETIYVQILGLKKEGTEELSWGKAQLLVDQKKLKPSTSTQNMPTPYMSNSFNKSSLKITKSAFKETLAKYNQSKSEWSITSAKIKRGYPQYLIRFYTDADQYAFKLIDETQTSGNARVTLGDITHYDTFITVLYWMDTANESSKLEQGIKLTELMDFYDDDFFKLYNFELPDNQTKKFKSGEPRFAFSGQREHELLQIFYLNQTDQQEVLAYLEKPNKLLSQKLREYLIGRVQSSE